MKQVHQNVRCKSCGRLLPGAYLGPCPHCASTMRHYTVNIAASGLQMRGSLKWGMTKEYYKKNKPLYWCVLLITVVSPFLGLVVAGMLGVVIGLVVGLLTFVLGLNAVTKVLEIREGRTD